jgi:hypothetical protein
MKRGMPPGVNPFPVSVPLQGQLTLDQRPCNHAGTSAGKSLGNACRKRERSNASVQEVITHRGCDRWVLCWQAQTVLAYAQTQATKAHDGLFTGTTASLVIFDSVHG